MNNTNWVNKFRFRNLEINFMKTLKTLYLLAYLYNTIIQTLRNLTVSKVFVTFLKYFSKDKLLEMDCF